MRNYDDFQAALADWREGGGAMLGHDIDPGSDHPSWQVGEYEEIADATQGDGSTVRGETMHALRVGGMSAAEIVREMADCGWTNEE